jgi:hypothetical protein
MGADYKPKVGDRIRVTFEDVVIDTSDGIELANSHYADLFVFDLDEPTLVSVEKIEPPVEVFKPGDVVTRPRSGGHPIMLLETGYVRVGKPHLHPYGHGCTRDFFTSEHFQRVELVAKPF